MPLYDYKCEKCDAVFEVSHRMSETPDLECPKCQAKEVRKVLTTGGLVGTSTGGCDAPALPASSGGCCPGGMCGL